MVPSKYSFLIGLFHIAPCKVIDLNLLCFIYGIISLLLFLIAFFKVVALQTIAIAIVVALSLLFANAFKSLKESTKSSFEFVLSSCEFTKFISDYIFLTQTQHASFNINISHQENNLCEITAQENSKGDFVLKNRF